MTIFIKQLLVTASLTFIIAYAVVLFSPYVLVKILVWVYALLSQRGNGLAAEELAEIV